MPIGIAYWPLFIPLRITRAYSFGHCHSTVFAYCIALPIAPYWAGLAFIFRLDPAFIFRLDTAIIFRLATAVICRLDAAIIFRLDTAIIFRLDIAINFA